MNWHQQVINKITSNHLILIREKLCEDIL